VSSTLSQSELSYEPPRTASERTLAEIFAELLRVERVGVADNFFSLGGNSLTAVKLIARVRMEFGVRLPLWVVFQFASVSDLAGQLDGRFKASAAS
jgi:mycobactin peptide synthetase MbtE